MRQKICVVTGGSGGIGKATAAALARLDAEVVLVNCSPERGAAACREIRAQTGNPNIHFIAADLSSQTEIRRLAGQLTQRYPRIHVLVNVAGSMFHRWQTSPDGLELTFALNYLSYFLLTGLLLDTLIQSAPARIINVSSVAHCWGRIDLADLPNPRGYSMFAAYGNSKLAINLFTRLLAARLQGSGVTAVSAHPGIVATGIIARVIDHPLVSRLADAFFLSPAQSAEHLLHLAAGPDADRWNGGYMVRGQPGWCTKTSRDLALAEKLWQASEEWTHLNRQLAQVREYVNELR